LSDQTEGGGGVSIAACPLLANARAASISPENTSRAEILRQGVPDLSFAADVTRVPLPYPPVGGLVFYATVDTRRRAGSEDRPMVKISVVAS
jgi:hypothetical protein